MTSPKDKVCVPEQNTRQAKPDSGPLDPILLKKWLSQYNELIMIGRLTPEVVHDINNHLTGILGYTELLSMKKIEDESIKKGLQNIYISAERCKELLSNLTSLSRQESSMIRLESLNEVIEKMIVLRNCALRHKQITVLKELGHDIPAVPLPGNKLEKVLLSLIFYAEEALEQREKDRKLTFKTVFQAPDEAIIVMALNGPEKTFTYLSNLFGSNPTSEKEDLITGFGQKELEQWLGKLGASLELKREGEEGFLFVIHLPVKK